MTSRSGWQFDRTGDHLALDFANTVSDRGSDRPIERLASYADVVEFARQTGIAPVAQSRRLLDQAERHPRKAATVHRDAVELRDSLYRLFARVVRGEGIAEADLEVLNRFTSRLQVGPDLRWQFRADPDGLESVLGPVVLAAVELATDTEQRERVGLCGAPECGWLIYDKSKNRSRRWCDMKACGNRMKARRFQERHR